MDVMIDLETLHTSPSAAILTIGIVKFDPKHLSSADQLRANALLIKLDVDEQFALGRAYSEDTVAWWGNQPQEIQDAAFSGDRTPLAEGIDKFHKLVWNSDRYWSQGSFDYVILEDLYRTMQRTPPWAYWQCRDSRTMFDFIDGKLDRTGHHDAMEDSIQQALAVQRALKKIGWRGEKL
jgi:hypothetical protein